MVWLELGGGRLAAQINDVRIVVATVALLGLVRWNWSVPWIVLGAGLSGVLASMVGMPLAGP